MKTFCTWIATLLLATTTAQASTDFLELVPDDALFVISITDGASFQERWDESPISKACAQVDLTGFIKGLDDAAEDEDEDEEFEAEEILLLIERLGSLYPELPGASCFYVGNIEAGLQNLQKNKLFREEILGDGEMDEEEELSDEQEKRLLALDRSDMNGILANFRFLADVDGEAKDLISKLEDWAREDEEDMSDDEEVYTFDQIEIEGTTVYRGQTFYLDDDGEKIPSDIPDELWAITDSILVVTFTEKAMREQLASLQNPERAIDEDELIREAVSFTERGDMTIIFNLPKTHDLIAAFLSGQEDTTDPSNPMAISPMKALDWFGLKTLRPYVFSVTLEEDGMSGKSHLGFTAPTILSELFLQQHEGGFPRPAFAHRDFMSVSSGHYRIADAYQALETQLGTLSPQAAAGLGMVRMMGAGQLGIDFKTQLLDHFDSRFVMVQDLDLEKFEASIQRSIEQAENGEAEEEMLTPGQGFLFAMGVKNKTDLESSLKTLAAKFSAGAEPELETYNETEIFVPAKGIAETQGMAPEDLICYAWIEDYLLISIGDGNLIKKAIDATANPDLQLWDSPAFTDVWEKIGGEANYIEYANQESAMKLMETALGPLQMLFEDEGLANFPDFSGFEELFSSSLSVSRSKGLAVEMDSFTLYNEKLLP